jgi:signal transduction histidine kinase
MNMLAYSKQRRPEFQMVNLPGLIHEVVELAQPQCDRRNVALITEIDEDMPPIPADPGGLHQALMNLVNNAIDAVEPDTGAVTISVQYDAIAHQVTIVVSDNGPGIEADDLSRVYQPFYSTKGQRGTGLGLAVTRKIIDEHGGRIHVHSSPEEGTTFTIGLTTESKADPSATAS